MEVEASEYIRRKEWAKAAEVYNNLLMSKCVNKDRLVSYLLGRSECFLELGQHEAVVADCRRIIKLLEDEKEDVIGFRVRRRLVHALFSLHRFPEAELATREWLTLQSDLTQNSDVTKLLEHLHGSLEEADQKGQLEAYLFTIDTKLESIASVLNGENQNTENVSCIYCNVMFKNKMDLRMHCQTQSHQMIIMSDEGRDWFWRPPPRGLSTEQYLLCKSWNNKQNCHYGVQCTEAHGPEELEEWKERFEYRRMKLQRAYDKELYGKSYSEQLLEKLSTAPSTKNIISGSISDVEEICSNELTATIISKTSTFSWNFILKTWKILKVVALLEDAQRNHFELVHIKINTSNDTEQAIKINNNQEWISELIQNVAEHNVIYTYSVTVHFQTNIFGTFRQSVIFDFGTEPILIKQLCADVVSTTEAEKLSEILKEITLSNAERWNAQNSTIISFASNAFPTLVQENDWINNLLLKYPCPLPKTLFLSNDTVINKKLTRNNYKVRMHELLYIEEMAQYDQVAEYNLKGNLQIVHSYVLTPNGVAGSTTKYSTSGELFALMNLSKELSEDTSAGRLILSNCTTVLLTTENHDETGEHKVYEALIEDKIKNAIYLRLSGFTVKDLNLAIDTNIEILVQFQLNRIPYCEWHYAIDKIVDYRMIFPEIYLEPNIPWTPQRHWSDSLDTRLNLKQKEAIMAITTPSYIPLPPVLIIGPYGTGKTFTLAQAVKQLMLQSDTRILICTHSNSAADLYIKDYLHPFVAAGHEEARPLRVYYHKRWVSTVNQVVQKYCLIEDNHGMKCFRIPTVVDVVKYRIVVVTLSTSVYLSAINLPVGHFTHILLDEAAQAIECEGIIPLTLANCNTRIVLAGDHMQLSPELFSKFAKERNFHISLLERLYNHYPATYPCKIMLCENYRAHTAIIEFTSELFYNQKLIASGKQPRHQVYYPLTFFTTMGEDKQDQNSTAFYNNSEVYEIAERVLELKKNWPVSWGKLDEQSIGIMTPYADQVFRIRSELRKRRLGGISVERVLNVQGKQFRAIFLSTVRTRHTCINSKANDEVDYGFLSNSKLLNTAITRAQSLVAVVGDPVTLCSVGRCSKVWEMFIETCNRNNSLYGITWSSLRSRLDGVEFKKTYVLNPLAPEFVPRSLQIPFNVPIPTVTSFPLINISNFATASMSREHFMTQKPFCLAPGPLPPNYSQKQMWPIQQVPSETNNLIRNPPTRLHQQFVNHNSIQSPIDSYPISQVNHRLLPDSSQHNHCVNDVNKTKYVSLPTTPNNYKVVELENTSKKTLPKALIQFLDNVHFPEETKQVSTLNNSLFSDFVNLLPRNMTLAEMLLQPSLVHIHWFNYLCETKGVDTAKKFEFLIHISTKKDLIPTNYPMQLIPPLHNSSTSYQEKSIFTDMPQNNVTLQGPPFYRNYPINVHNSWPNIPYIEEHSPNLNWFNKPANQINFDKPVYLKDLDNSLISSSLQQHSNTDIGLICIPTQSVPLYQRHGTPQIQNNFDFPNNLIPNHTIINDRLPSEMFMGQLLPKEKWQQQINADFENLKINNDITEETGPQTFASASASANIIKPPISIMKEQNCEAPNINFNWNKT